MAQQHIHILGICGTFMGGIALLARERGIQVSGCDANVYPPMSTQLEQAGIELHEGYAASALPEDADMFVIGNAMSRGNEAVEHILNQGLPYTSGPQWLAENVLQGRWVLGVAGTHGKTTTASMLAWILDYAKLAPGFLIGGVPENFSLSARLGSTPFFVVEADEYDSAFFDKRSKFVHYRPRTTILNNLEFDHADIFADLAAIQTQFHHLVRTVPGKGLLVVNAEEESLAETLEKGCWTPVQTFAESADAEWQVTEASNDFSHFGVKHKQTIVAHVKWDLLGRHNAMNALAAIVAARHAGVPVDVSAQALCRFAGVKRRLQLCGEVNGIHVFDDFAHHPTAIETTIAGLRHHQPGKRIVAVLEPRSNTMKMGVHKARLAESLTAADAVFIFEPEGLGWSVADSLATLPACEIIHSIDGLLETLVNAILPGDQVLIMSNGGFGGVHEKLLSALRVRYD